MKSTPTDIDRLYGLEPVLEPGDGSGSDALEQFVDAGCPYCSETITFRLDLSAGSQTYVEDCQVCCQAIELSMTVAGDGSLEALNLSRVDV
jgi:cysteine-rich CPXCG protein